MRDIDLDSKNANRLDMGNSCGCSGKKHRDRRIKMKRKRKEGGKSREVDNLKPTNKEEEKKTAKF